MIFRRAILLAALVALSATTAYCADALMGRYDPEQTGYTAEKLQPPLSLNWQFTANKYEDNPAAPVVSNGTVFLACGDYVYAVDLETGNQKWKYPTDQGLGGSVKGTPLVYDGMVYFGAGDGNLYCVSADTGTYQWHYQTRGAIRCTPVVSDGVIFTGSDDNSLYAVQAASGDQAWKQFAAKDDFAVGVALGSGIVAAACMDGYMYGVSANAGRLKWLFRLPSAPTRTSPIFSDNVVIMAVGNMMYGASARSGQMRWAVALPSDAAATPAASGADIYVACRDRKIYAYTVSGRQITLKWTEPALLDSVPMSSPTIADNILYVTGSRGVVAAFSTVDGSQKWRYVISPSSVNTPGSAYTDAASPPVVANGNLLVLTDDGVLHCFSPNAPDDEAPEPYGLTPASGTAMSGAPPFKISAVLYDMGSGVDFSSAAMFIDNQPVESLDIDEAAYTVKYVAQAADSDGAVKAKLAAGLHTITLTAKDYAGNLLTKEWFFIADPSMSPPKKTISQKDRGKNTKEPPKKTIQPAPQPPMPGEGGPGPGPGMPPPPPPPPGMPSGGPGGPGGSDGPPPPGAAF